MRHTVNEYELVRAELELCNELCSIEDGGGPVSEVLARKFCRLQARVAELEAAAPPPGATDDVVLVSRELVKDVADCVLQVFSSRYLASALQACLAAPAPRVVGPGDVVISRIVAGYARSTLLGFPDSVLSSEMANALAVALEAK